MWTSFCFVIVFLQYHVNSENPVRKSGGSHWGYEGEQGPENWHKDYPDCGKNAQSPIVIEKWRSGVYEFDQLKVYGYDTERSGLILENNGHTVQLSLAAGDKDTPYIEGGGLGAKYYFRQLHFHWGLKNLEGSEHILNENYGRSLEMHLVHTNPDENKDGQAGIAVLGILFQATESSNQNYHSITNGLNAVKYEGSKTVLGQGFSLQSLLPNSLSYQDFYRYNGSLTTPPCTEGVIWTVMDTIHHIGNEQMELFRSVYSTSEDDPNPKSMAPNFRPIQELNYRTVFRNKP